MHSAQEWIELATGPDGKSARVDLAAHISIYSIGRGAKSSVDGNAKVSTERITLGRDAKAVSNNHACLVRDSDSGEAWRYIDLHSTNGSYRNGQHVEQFLLEDGDEIWLGPPNTAVSGHIIYRNKRIIPQVKRLEFRPSKADDSVLVGSDSSRAQLRLFSNQADGLHARIAAEHQFGSQVYRLEDLGSAMGTYVNERPLKPGSPYDLKPRDHVRFADCRYVVRLMEPQHLVLAPLGAESDEHLFARGLVYTVRADAGSWSSHWVRYTAARVRNWRVQWRSGIVCQGQAVPVRPNRYKTLLQGVDFVVGPNDFVVLAGASGSGKTTLMHTLSTFLTPDRGGLFYKGMEYTARPEILRGHIGYVPQDDIVHEQLNLYDALLYAAELRLPASVGADERVTLVHAVLRQLRLVQQSNQRVSKLSGGQRKRANIAVELLNEPGILFLDEPTEGQDLALEESIMTLLRRLANDGTSIVLVSHRLNFLEYADYVGWLAPGGYLAYFGPPEKVADYFEIPPQGVPTRRYADVYKKLEGVPDPSELDNAFRTSRNYVEFIEGRREPASVQHAGQKYTQSQSAKTQVGWWRQFGTLLRRSTKILTNDSIFLLLMIVQAPLIGRLLFELANADMFELAQAGNLVAAQQLLYLMSTSAVVSGVCVAMRELVKERRIYWRERMVGLKLGPYLLSKIVLLMIFCLYESAVLVWFVLSKATPPEHGVFSSISVPFEMLITLFLTMFGGTMLGLLLSAMAKSQESLGLLVPLALIPQLALSKALGFSLTGVVDILSKATFGYWAVEGLGDSAGLRSRSGSDYFGPDYDPTVSHLLVRWSALILISAVVIWLVWVFQVRRDRYQGNG